MCYKWIIKKFINKKKKSIEKKNTIKTSTFFQYKNSIRDLFTKKCNNENNYCQNNVSYHNNKKKEGEVYFIFFKTFKLLRHNRKKNKKI